MRLNRIRRFISSILGQSRLAHGHTHLTWMDKNVVYKRFTGPKSSALYKVEYETLKHMNSRVPVPGIVSSDQSSLTIGLRKMEGKCLMDAPYPEPALEYHRQAGLILSRIQNIPTPSGCRADECWVHGDFNPKNIIYSPTPKVEILVLDWEQAHFGSSMEDLCWYEWIVRNAFSQTQYRAIMKAFFNGYGPTPAWNYRKKGIVLRLESIISNIDDSADNKILDYWNQQLAEAKRMTSF